MSRSSEPRHLTAEQIQRFICDGFLILQADVPAAVNETINTAFDWVAKNERNPGNNVLPRVPELALIQSCSVVRGAVTSLLGENVQTYTHRYWHSHGPSTATCSDEAMERDLRQHTHQDSFPPVIRPRTHGNDALRVMYYPSQVSLLEGPTCAVPGSHYQSTWTDFDRSNGVPIIAQAGTIIVSHFDIVHSWVTNQSDAWRHMMKFIFIRGRQDEAPAASFVNQGWAKPVESSAPFELDNCWRAQWRRLTGAKSEPKTPESASALCAALFDAPLSEDRIELIQEIGRTRSPSAIDTLMALLGEGHQPERTSAIYALAEIGAPAIPALVARIQSAVSDRAVSVLHEEFIPVDDACYALIDIGEECIDAVLPLLTSSSQLVVINGLEVLGSIAVVRDDVMSHLQSLLDHSSAVVVGEAIRAIGRLGDDRCNSAIIAMLERHYDSNRVNKFGWPEEWDVHFAAAAALAQIGVGLEPIEDEIAKHINHPSGQVGEVLGTCLRLIGTPSALAVLLDSLSTRRWDASITYDRQF